MTAVQISRGFEIQNGLNQSSHKIHFFKPNPSLRAEHSSNIQFSFSKKARVCGLLGTVRGGRHHQQWRFLSQCILRMPFAILEGVLPV